MALDLNQVGNLLGAQKPVRPNVYDLVTGNNRQDVTTASLRNLLSGETPTNLTEAQESTISGIETFITDNVSESDSPKLLESLAGLRQLLELGNTDTNLDPIFSLLSANSSSIDITNLLKTGSIFDQLA